MCREVEKLINEARAEGVAESFAEGVAEVRVHCVRAVMENLSVSFDDAIAILKYSDADKEMIRKTIGQISGAMEELGRNNDQREWIPADGRSIAGSKKVAILEKGE